MTRIEFYNKYGDVKVKFSGYYKYTFSYTATLPDGKLLSCGYGGNQDEIYRHTVTAGGENTVNSLGPYMGSVHENDVEIESFYDY